MTPWKGITVFSQAQRGIFDCRRLYCMFCSVPFWFYYLVKQKCGQPFKYRSTSNRTVSLPPSAGWCPAALCPVCSRWGAGHPPRWPGQRDQAVVGRQRHTKLLCTVTGVSAQWLCRIVSAALGVFPTLIPLRNRFLWLCLNEVWESNAYYSCY